MKNEDSILGYVIDLDKQQEEMSVAISKIMNQLNDIFDELSRLKKIQYTLEEKADKYKKRAFRRGLKIGFGTGFVSGLLIGRPTSTPK